MSVDDLREASKASPDDPFVVAIIDERTDEVRGYIERAGEIQTWTHDIDAGHAAHEATLPGADISGEVRHLSDVQEDER